MRNRVYQNQHAFQNKEEQASTEFIPTNITDLLVTPLKLHLLSPERKIQVWERTEARLGHTASR